MITFHISTYELSYILYVFYYKKTTFDRNICPPLGGLPIGKQMGLHWFGESVRLIEDYV